MNGDQWNPASLQNLASNEFVRLLWRIRLKNSCQNGTLSDILGNFSNGVSFNCLANSITFDITFPRVDMEIPFEEQLSGISKMKFEMRHAFSALQKNTKKWLDDHVKFFSSHCEDQTHNSNRFDDLVRDYNNDVNYAITAAYILNRFDKFVYDKNNFINYVETARKMTQCGDFDSVDKYNIAKDYGFESVKIFYRYMFLKAKIYILMN